MRIVILTLYPDDDSVTIATKTDERTYLMIEPPSVDVFTALLPDQEPWYETIEKLWFDLARVEEIGPSSFGLSDELMNHLYADLRKITTAGAPDEIGWRGPGVPQVPT